MDLATAEAFAAEWVAAWNSHDLERIMTHYSDDVTFVSPRIVEVTGDPSGRVVGKAELRAYWAKALSLAPDLHFTVEAVHASVDGLVINFCNQQGLHASEVLMFQDGRITHGIAAKGRLREVRTQSS